MRRLARGSVAGFAGATLVCAVAGAAGCASLGGLSTPEEGAAPPDGGLDSAASGEASRDAGKGDSDATSDGPRFCAGRTSFFCADFDDGLVNSGWSETITTNGGTFALDALPARSPPASLRARGDADLSTAFLRKALPVASAGARVALAINGGCVGSKPFTGSWPVLAISCVKDGPFAGAVGGATLALGQGGSASLSATYQGPSEGQVAFGFPIAADGWRVVSIDVTFGNPGRIVATVDGIVLTDADPPIGCAGLSALDVFVGVRGACAVNIDDVVIDTRP